VNTASRMESSGEVGQVNSSEATVALVKDAKKVNGEWELANGGSAHSPFTNSHSPAFTFTPRDKVQSKGSWSCG
jgi:class 3 adenylate cyclase